MTEQQGKPPAAKGIAHLIRSCGYSCNGFREAWKEAAFRQEIAVGIIIIPVAWLMPVSIAASAALTVLWLALLVTELLNTAIEAIVDLASPGYHILAKRSKDLASAAVTCAIAANVIGWLAVVIPLFRH